MLRARIATFLTRNRWVLNLIFIAMGSYFVGGAVNAVVAREIRVVPTAESFAGGSAKPARSRSRGKASFSAMANRNLFGAKREVMDPVASQPDPDPSGVTGSEYSDDELKDCSLPISLRGTLVSEEPTWSVAMVYNNSKRETQAFSIIPGSNQIVDDAVLVKIKSREIIIRRSDHFERCVADAKPKARGVSRGTRGGSKSSASSSSRKSSGGGKGVTKVSDTEYSIEREEVDRVLGNLSAVATKARIVPSFKNGKPNGFKLFSIKPGSIYSKIGLQNGDVVQRINGYEMNSPDKALEIYQKLQDSSSITVDIQRRGRSMTLNYTIGR